MTFTLGDFVAKKYGARWRGRVVGSYGTDLTEIGYVVKSWYESNSVQNYPEATLEPWTPPSADDSADATIARLSAELDAAREMTLPPADAGQVRRIEVDIGQAVAALQANPELADVLNGPALTNAYAELDAAREALAEAGEFIASHISDIEDGQNPKDAEYLRLAIKCWDRARAVLAKLSAKGA